MRAQRCQIAHCDRTAGAWVYVEAELALEVCRRCAALEQQIRAAWTRGAGIARYVYQKREVIVASTGATPTPLATEGYPFVSDALTGPPYWLPCLDCGTRILYRGGGSILCEPCWAARPDEKRGAREDAPPLDPVPEDGQLSPAQTTPPATEEQGPIYSGRPWGDGQPFWLALRDRLRVAAREAWEERAAIMEYDGEMSRVVAEHRAYELLVEKARAAGLPT